MPQSCLWVFVVIASLGHWNECLVPIAWILIGKYSYNFRQRLIKFRHRILIQQFLIIYLNELEGCLGFLAWTWSDIHKKEKGTLWPPDLLSLYISIWRASLERPKRRKGWIKKKGVLRALCPTHLTFFKAGLDKTESIRKKRKLKATTSTPYSLE